MAENRALAKRWSAQVHEIAQTMFDELSERIGVVSADPELAALTLASCSSNVEAIASMFAAGIPASAAEAPVTALEHARAMAARGAEVNDTLRFYRLGQGHFLRRWSDELQESVGDPDRVLAALREASQFVVEYLDVVSGRVSAEHLAERERRQRRAAVLRADLVRALLAGEPQDLDAAARTLGHRLDGPQWCFICWGERPEGQLVERLALAIGAACGAPRPLLVPDGPEALIGWIGRDPAAAGGLDIVETARAGTAPELSVAAGTTGTGLEGFRNSHDEAVRARRVADLVRAPPSVVAFDEVALLDVLTRDVDTARRFAARELGPLGADDPASAELRATLRLVLAPRGGLALAARQLGVHRNTILQRVRRAEGLLGHSVDRRGTELFVALLLFDRLDGELSVSRASRPARR